MTYLQVDLRSIVTVVNETLLDARKFLLDRACSAKKPGSQIHMPQALTPNTALFRIVNLSRLPVAAAGIR